MLILCSYKCRESKDDILKKYSEALKESPLNKIGFYSEKGQWNRVDREKNITLDNDKVFKDVSEECEDIYKLIEFSDYKYYGNCRRGWLLMRWLMDWPGIKDNTPLFDSVKIDNVFHPYLYDEKSAKEQADRRQPSVLWMDGDKITDDFFAVVSILTLKNYIKIYLKNIVYLSKEEVNTYLMTSVILTVSLNLVCSI